MKNYTNLWLAPSASNSHLDLWAFIFNYQFRLKLSQERIHIHIEGSIDIPNFVMEMMKTLCQVVCLKKSLGVWGSESSTCWVYHGCCIWAFSLEKVKQQYVCKYRWIHSYACKDLHKCENVQMRLQTAVNKTMWCWWQKRKYKTIKAVDEHEFHYHSHSAWWTSQYPTNATAGHEWQRGHKFLPKQMKCIDWKSIIFPTMKHLFTTQKPK